MYRRNEVEDLRRRLRMEKSKIDEEVSDGDGKLSPCDVAFLNSLPAIPITRQEIREIVLSVMEEAIVDAARG